MTKILRVIILVAVLVLTVLTVIQGQEELPRYERVNCPIYVPNEPTIECGYLVTFKEYDNLGSRKIRNAVIIIHSSNENTMNKAFLFTENHPLIILSDVPFIL